MILAMSLEKRHDSGPTHALKNGRPVIALSPCTRREFAKWSLATLPAFGIWSALDRLGAAEAPRGKPNSKFSGVQVGLNVPYSFANASMSGDDILKNCLQLGLSAVELRTQPVEAFLGVPVDLIFPKKTADAPSPAARAEQLAKWRKSVSMDQVKEFRKKYEDAGVLISPSCFFTMVKSRRRSKRRTHSRHRRSAC